MLCIYILLYIHIYVYMYICLNEYWNYSGIHYASFIRLKISSRISFLAQAFELLILEEIFNLK